MKRTTVGKVFVSTYAVVLVPTGVIAFVADAYDQFSSSSQGWANSKVWLGLALEGGLLASPFVFVFSLVVTFLNNLFAKD